jgi:hypothetical protein
LRLQPSGMSGHQITTGGLARGLAPAQLFSIFLSLRLDFPRNLLGVTESFWRGLRGFGHGLVSWALAAPGMRTTEGTEAAFHELQQKMVRTSAR